MTDFVDWLERLMPILIILLFVIVGMIYTHLRERLYLKHEESPKALPASQIFKVGLNDIAAILAFGIFTTVVVLALTQTPIPDVIEKAFYIVVSYYFGARSAEKLHERRKREIQTVTGREEAPG